ncbi:unnamed protein product [Rotaria sordida]|uniref:F-box domain-containing protein n=1 Tax=Rotaria sordida TaxID=392033 RepID=A0A813SU22_9BILA|nr:unnamed protein product [Rotaria sordida]CAF0801857.1 unnamed protein product [Rotaria sordida]CAF0850528.1 unnamed protein product [Rotaria sordida]CAF3609986.1 unnamed protein product [Rotaria sordida]
MNSDLSRLEQLPNEILIDLFQYFDARDLFQSFSNLNYRLNKLIKSFHHLNLFFHMEFFLDNQIDNNDYFPFYVYTLIVGRAININLNRFLNIRYLKLECPLKRVLAQLNSNILPYLKHLSISHLDILITIDEWISLPSLHTLKISCITSLAYQTILTACPNLVYLELSIFSSDQLKLNIESHKNLKKMIINVIDMIWPWDDKVFHSYLSCVPNLEKLNVYRSIFVSKITESLLNYDWLASKIDLYLLLLCRFNFYLKVIRSDIFIEPNIENILCQIEEIFLHKHNNRYQSRHLIYK